MLAAGEDDLKDGPIHQGATRPPMVPRIGLPFSAAVPLCAVAALIQMNITGLVGLAYAVLFMLVVGLPLRIWVSYDWYAIENIVVWLRTSGPTRDNRFWGGSTVSHFPSKPALLHQNTRGMCHV